MNDNLTPPTGEPVKPDTLNDQNSPETAAPSNEQMAPPAGSPIDMPAPAGAEAPPPAGEPIAIPAPATTTEQQPVIEPEASSPEDTTQVLPISDPEPVFSETPVAEVQQVPIEPVNEVQHVPAPTPTASYEAPVQAAVNEVPAPAPAASYTTPAYSAAPVDATQPVPTPAPSPVPSGVQPMPAPAPGVGTTPYPPTAPAKKKKSKKPLIITLIVVAAVIILAIVGVLVFQEVERSNAYDAAMELYQSEDYRAAAGAFSELGDYRDSADMVGESNEQQRLKEEREALEAAKLQFEDAVALFDAGEFSGARSEFVALKDTKLEEDLDEWIHKCDYALAEALYAAGDVEGAYNAFLALGSYSDSADRAAAIPQAFPATSIIYQDPAYYYAGAAIDIDYRFSSGGSFYKIYSGEVLVASLFLNANTTQRVYLAPGNYTIKEGSGDIWFGPEVAFGKDGWYSIMTFDDTGTDYIALTDNALVTLTINSGSSGNVSEKGEDHSNF